MYRLSLIGLLLNFVVANQNITKHDHPIGGLFSLDQQRDSALAYITEGNMLIVKPNNILRYLHVAYFLGGKRYDELDLQIQDDIFYSYLIMTMIHELHHINQIIDRRMYAWSADYAKLIEDSNNAMMYRYLTNSKNIFIDMKNLMSKYGYSLSLDYIADFKSYGSICTQYYRYKTMKDVWKEKFSLLGLPVKYESYIDSGISKGTRLVLRLNTGNEMCVRSGSRLTPMSRFNNLVINKFIFNLYNNPNQLLLPNKVLPSDLYSLYLMDIAGNKTFLIGGN